MSSIIDETPQFRLVTVGEAGVGKTSIILRYTDNSFSEDYKNTIGVDFKVKELYVNSKKVILKIWDTAGQETFRSITKQYFDNADGIFLVFDLSNRLSYANLQEWIDLISQSGNDYAKILLVGNKCDIDRCVSSDESNLFAYNHHIDYFETSAKDGTNIEEIFQYMAENCNPRPDVHPVPNTDQSCKC